MKKPKPRKKAVPLKRAREWNTWKCRLGHLCCLADSDSHWPHKNIRVREVLPRRRNSKKKGGENNG